MKTKNKRVIIFLSFCIIWVVSGYYYNKYFHENVRAKKKMYCYETYSKVVNPVLFVENKRHIDSLISYYQKIENGESNPTFNFQPLSLPYDTCVYVLGYERDSLIAKVICYYDWGNYGNYVKGYVYINTLHGTPPPDSLIKKR